MATINVLVLFVNAEYGGPGDGAVLRDSGSEPEPPGWGEVTTGLNTTNDSSRLMDVECPACFGMARRGEGRGGEGCDLESSHTVVAWSAIQAGE